MPPPLLAKRVGMAGAKDLYAAYEQIGARCRDQILHMLPAGYELEGRRLLDFGCGAGRTLRHFLDDADSAEIWGCDIDADSIDWLERNLCPPLRVLRNQPEPDLPFEDGHFDLVWALSVFTHLVETWAGWLLEVHRVLADDGILIASTLGPHQSERLANEAWEEDRVGMNALRHPGSGGPIVFHSTWWLRAHWGRAFEILEIDESPVAGKQRWLAMRKRDVTPSPSRISRARSRASSASSPPRSTMSNSCGASWTGLPSTPHRRARKPSGCPIRPSCCAIRPSGYMSTGDC